MKIKVWNNNNQLLHSGRDKGIPSSCTWFATSTTRQASSWVANHGHSDGIPLYLVVIDSINLAKPDYFLDVHMNERTWKYRNINTECVAKNQSKEANDDWMNSGCWWILTYIDYHHRIQLPKIEVFTNWYDYRSHLLVIKILLVHDGMKMIWYRLIKRLLLYFRVYTKKENIINKMFRFASSLLIEIDVMIYFGSIVKKSSYIAFFAQANINKMH